MSGLSESKLTKYRLLRASSAVSGTLPRTRTFSKRALYNFLARYPKVIAKPTGGSGGAGVMMVTDSGGGSFRVHRGARIRTVQGKHGVYQYLRARIKTSYLIQRGISLARVNGRPFDVRVMVQRKPGSRWTVTGMLAKVAGRGYIITNVKRSGGYVLPLSTAIRRSNIRGVSTSAVLARLARVALFAARRLDDYYSSQQVFGFDMGVDASGKVWIIEANLRPDISLFQKLRNKSMYHTILAYRR